MARLLGLVLAMAIAASAYGAPDDAVKAAFVAAYGGPAASVQRTVWMPAHPPGCDCSGYAGARVTLSVEPERLVALADGRYALVSLETDPIGPRGAIAIAYLRRSASGWRLERRWDELAWTGSGGVAADATQTLTRNGASPLIFAIKASLHQGQEATTAWAIALGAREPRLLGYFPLGGRLDADNGCGFDVCGAYQYQGALRPAPAGSPALFAVTYRGWRQAPGDPREWSFTRTTTFSEAAGELKATRRVGLPDCALGCALGYATASNGAGASAGEPRCGEEIARQISSGAKAPADLRCWRVGPLALGMTASEVTSRLWTPDLTETVDDRFAGPETLWFYAFPRSGDVQLGRRPADAPSPDVLELTFRKGMVAAISNDPPETFRGPPCRRTEWKDEAAGKAADPEFAPFLHFAGVRVGDPLASLETAFGRAPSPNASKDFYSYFPTPISFDVDPDRRVISGFSIGADFRTLTSGRAANFLSIRNPRTCAITAYELMSGPA